MERKSILKERVAYEAVVAFIHKCTELGLSQDQTNKLHLEVEGLIKAGIEIGRKENTTAEESDVVLNDFIKFNCIQIDLENSIFKLNKHDIPKNTKHIKLEFKNGVWSFESTLSLLASN